MGRRTLAAALLLLGACKAELAGDQGIDASSSQEDGKVFLDAAIDSPPVLGAWGTPSPIIGASDDAVQEDDGTLSSDGLELYFKRDDAGDTNIYVMTRASSTSTMWTTPAPVPAVNTTTDDEESPRLSPDNLTMYFGRNGDIYQVTRTTTADAWANLAPVTPLNTAGFEKWGVVCNGGYAMVSRNANNGNGQDIYDGTITGGAPNPVTSFNTTFAEQGILLSPDCTHVYFQSNRDNMQFDIYEASRPNANASWQNPTKMSDFNTTTQSEEDPWTSIDQRTFVFVSNVNGTKDLFISTR